MKFQDRLTVLNGIASLQAKRFEELGIYSLADLINYYPRRYDDYSEVSLVKDLKPGPVSLKVKITNLTGRYAKTRGLHISEAIASDASGSVKIVWFNQPFRLKSFKSNKTYYLSGSYELKNNHFSIINPATELVSDLPVNTARILAIYPESKNIDSRLIRKLMLQLSPLIDQIPESLPGFIIKDQKLISLSQALKLLHMPDSRSNLEAAKRRLGFEEVFNFALASLISKQINQAEKSISIKFSEDLAKAFIASLPFKLTDSQRLAVWRIYLDMQSPTPMNRLVEGDVGSGKTVVAVMAALMVLKANKQVALMAPTELLARQHAETIYNLLKPVGLESKLSLLVGSLKSSQKQIAYKFIKNNQASFIVGTHALIQEKVDIKNLALVIVDEQHRFGVKQRTALIAKAGHMPHVLSLSATPIPRSLALTLYGELDITRLKQKPSNRLPVDTTIIYPSQVAELYTHVDQEIKAGRQVFIVCPAIHEAEHGLKSATQVYEELSRGVFRHRRLGLLHGQLKTDIKQQVMKDFVYKKLDILVATTVIEVGVDVPNASLMIVFSPERFGLAQLHQLRGRIGRGDYSGHFYMIVESDKSSLKRLRALERSSDGFDLAELDLKLRGPGAIYGTYQHGALDLRIANLNDRQLISEAVNGAHMFIDQKEALDNYPVLKQKINQLRAVTNLN